MSVSSHAVDDFLRLLRQPCAAGQASGPDPASEAVRSPAVDAFFTPQASSAPCASSVPAASPVPCSFSPPPAFSLSAAPGLPLLDVRSPSEFAKAHIPGAINVPLFDDAGIAAVGTKYKEAGRRDAVRLGLSLTGAGMAGLAARLCDLAPEGELALYCSRGGMRSASVAWLAGMLDLRCHVLSGGYKTFRRYALTLFERPRVLLVLGGHSGAGKTAVLRDVAALGGQFLDLEGLARHRGSAFGSFEGVAQPSCEHFENLLASALDAFDPALPVWLEDESRNLGTVNVPHALMDAMGRAPLLLLESPREERLERLLGEYGGIDRHALAHDIDRIKKRLGGAEHKRAKSCLDKGDLPALAGILLDYYDRAYDRQLRYKRPAVSLPQQGPACTARELRRLEADPRLFADVAKTGALRGL